MGQEGIHYTIRTDPNKVRCKFFFFSFYVFLVEKLHSKMSQLPGPGEYNTPNLIGNTSRSKL